MTECLTDLQIKRRQLADARANLAHVCRELDVDPKYFRCFDPRHAVPVLASVLFADLMRYKDLPDEPNPAPYTWEE